MNHPNSLLSQGFTIWLTGLPGSGKTTLATHLEQALRAMNIPTYVLDGDKLRHGLNADLGFTPEARSENCRRIGEVAKLFAEAGMVCIVACISPYAEDREAVRKRHYPYDFIEIFVNCPIEICEARDPKGLYRKARQGEIACFTGISAPYESPKTPQLEVHTDQQNPSAGTDCIIRYLQKQGYIFVRPQTS